MSNENQRMGQLIKLSGQFVHDSFYLPRCLLIYVEAHTLDFEAAENMRSCEDGFAHFSCRVVIMMA